jgi:hypothetical protein
MPPVVHPGRFLKREIVVRKLSANRLSLDIGVPSRRVTDILNGRRAARPVLRQQRAVLARSAESVRHRCGRAGEGRGVGQARKAGGCGGVRYPQRAAPTRPLKTFANRLLSVGWVERSDTHQLHCFAEMKGFARAQPILRADILSFARDDIKPQAARPPLPL